MFDTHKIILAAMYLLTLVFLIRFAYTDIKHLKIYNRDIVIWLPFVLAFFIYRIFREGWIPLINPIVMFIFVGFILFEKMGKIGGGDVKVIILMAMIVPWFDFYIWLLAANLMALGVHYFFVLKMKMPSRLVQSPFGVSMCAMWLVYMLLFINNINLI